MWLSCYGISIGTLCVLQRDSHLRASFSGTTWVSQHQKGKTSLDFSEARDDGVAAASAGPYAGHLHLAADR